MINKIKIKSRVLQLDATRPSSSGYSKLETELDDFEPSTLQAYLLRRRARRAKHWSTVSLVSCELVSSCAPHGCVLFKDP